MTTVRRLTLLRCHVCGLRLGLGAVSDRSAQDERRCCVRQKRVVLAPVAGVKSAEVFARPDRVRKTVNSPMTEARGIRLRGEHGISRKTTVQGMPECSDCTCMLVCAFLRTYCTRDRGCSKHPAFPAPSFLWAKRFAKPGRNTPREGARVCPTVIAEDGFSGRVDRSRRNASSDIRPIIRGAPSRHSEECRQHQSRHEQNH